MHPLGPNHPRCPLPGPALAAALWVALANGKPSLALPNPTASAPWPSEAPAPSLPGMPVSSGANLDAEDPLEALEHWERRYRGRDVRFFEPRIGVTGSEPRYLARESVEEMERIFERAADTGSIAAAESFLRIATHYFAREPEREYRGADRIASQRPAWVRERAVEALASLPPATIGAWLVEGPLRDVSGSRSEYVRAAAARALGAMGYEPALYALRRQLDDRSPRVRTAVIEALASLGGASAIALFTPSLNDREAEVRATALRCIRRRILESPPDREAALALAHRLARMLEDRSWWVRRSAAVALAHLPFAESVPALLDALEAEHRRQVRSPSPRVSAAIRRTLASMTGQDFPRDDPRAWRSWWESAREDFRPAGPTKLDPRYQPSFYGITIEASRILFVVDVSASMGFSSRDPRYPDSGRTKLHQVRREVIRTLGALRPHHEFDLLFFSRGIHHWRGELVRATPDRVKAAVEFVEDRRAEGATDLWGALDEALDLGEPGRATPAVGFEADAIVLLSDGWPSIGDIVEPEEIVRLVARSNRHAEVVIHTISVQGDKRLRAAPTLRFMERLAEVTGGESRHVELE